MQPRKLIYPDGTYSIVEALPCPVIKKRDKELKSEIEAAVKDRGLVVQVFPPLPTSSLQGEQSFVFFDGAAVTVRIYETPATNRYGADCYDLLDRIALLLHFTNPGNVCATPMRIAKRPCAMVESPTQRIMDVFFTAVYQLTRP